MKNKMKNKMKKLISNTKSPQYNNPIIIVPSFWLSAIKGDSKVKVPKTVYRLNTPGPQKTLRHFKLKFF